MNRTMIGKQVRIIAIVFVLGLLPASAFPEGPEASPAVRPFPAEVADTLKIPPGEAEKRLAGNTAALADMKNNQAGKLYREYRQDGDMKKLYTALNTAGQAIKLDSGRYRYWVTLGNIHSELARLNIFRANEYAEESFRQAMELAPGDASVMVLLAVNLAGTGDYEEALEYFEKAAKTDVLILSADISQWMNACYLADAQTSRGIIFYEDIQKSHPRYYFLNLYKAVLYKAHFDNDKAIRELTQLLKRDDADGATKEAARKLLGEINRKGGRTS
ncbi:MAG TPA: hypothetical protein DCG53_12030 [Syntrophus sp. (in: bacteria)]|jgi:tetratricopeptide (TPR) repeat protein|nr:hypothetical protein [Syntrophus sp. (in: bacteria)]